MKREFLGDSYDAVKRLWGELLRDWAQLYAAPRFIPEELRSDFTRLTGIKILPDKPFGIYSILNDPDTGIRLPNKSNQTEGRTHIALPSIVTQLQDDAARCVITFDQSNYRTSGLKGQRWQKMQYLGDNGIQSFYYVSHAPFLFAASSPQALQELGRILSNAGIPAERLDGIAKWGETGTLPYFRQPPRKLTSKTTGRSWSGQSLTAEPFLLSSR